MMKPIALLSAAFFLSLAAAPAPAKTPQEGAANAAAPASGAQAQAKEIYARDCAMCHGERGDGQTGLAKSLSLTLHDWTDSKTLSGKSDQDLFAVIRKGKDKMPVEDTGRASDEQVKNLILYIRDFSKHPADATASPSR